MELTSREGTAGAPGFFPRVIVSVLELRVKERQVWPETMCTGITEPSVGERFPLGAQSNEPEVGAEVA